MGARSSFRSRFALAPRTTRLRQVAFQIHLYAGLGIALMMLAMGISGSAIALREPIQFALHPAPAPTEGAADRVSVDATLKAFVKSHPNMSIAALEGMDRPEE